MFSFLLAAPISLGAGVYKLYDLVKHPEAGVSGLSLVVGILVSGLVGMAVIKWLIKYLGTHNLRLFVKYRVVFGLIVIAVWAVRR